MKGTGIQCVGFGRVQGRSREDPTRKRFRIRMMEGNKMENETDIER